MGLLYACTSVKPCPPSRPVIHPCACTSVKHCPPSHPVIHLYPMEALYMCTSVQVYPPSHPIIHLYPMGLLYICTSVKPCPPSHPVIHPYPMEALYPCTLLIYHTCVPIESIIHVYICKGLSCISSHCTPVPSGSIIHYTSLKSCPPFILLYPCTPWKYHTSV